MHDAKDPVSGLEIPIKLIGRVEQFLLGNIFSFHLKDIFIGILKVTDISCLVYQILTKSSLSKIGDCFASPSTPCSAGLRSQ